MDLISSTNVVFSTNSSKYLHRLIPKEYQNHQESTKPECTFTLQDRSRVAYGIKSEEQHVIIDLNVLKKLSQIWHLVIPTLPGAPEFIISCKFLPGTALSATKQIICNVGHIKYYQLEVSDNMLSKELKAFMKQNFEPPTKTAKIIRHLYQIRNDDDSACRCLWPPAERLKTTIEFLDFLIRWADTKACWAHIEKKFERGIVVNHLEVFNQCLKWSQGKKVYQEKLRKERALLNRRKSKRLARRNGSES